MTKFAERQQERTGAMPFASARQDYACPASRPDANRGTAAEGVRPIQPMVAGEQEAKGTKRLSLCSRVHRALRASLQQIAVVGDQMSTDPHDRQSPEHEQRFVWRSRIATAVDNLPFG